MVFVYKYSGLPNESTALMRVLVDKKSKNAKSSGLQNVPNESTGWQKMQSLPVWIFHVKKYERNTYIEENIHLIKY